VAGRDVKSLFSNAEFGTADRAVSRITIYTAGDEGESVLCTIDQKGDINTANLMRPGVQHQMICSATPFVRSIHFIVQRGMPNLEDLTLLHICTLWICDHLNSTRCILHLACVLSSLLFDVAKCSGNQPEQQPAQSPGLSLFKNHPKCVKCVVVHMPLLT